MEDGFEKAIGGFLRNDDGMFRGIKYHLGVKHSDSFSKFIL